MKVNVKRPYQQSEVVEGQAARTLLKTTLKKLMHNILIPEPPHTLRVLHGYCTRLRMGNPLYSEVDEDTGLPIEGKTTVISMVPDYVIIRVQ